MFPKAFGQTGVKHYRVVAVGGRLGVRAPSDEQKNLKEKKGKAVSLERRTPFTAASHTHELKINRDLPPTPLLNSLLSYWHRCRGDRVMPARNDLDPLHIPKLLPSIMLIDVLRNPLDFRYRLIGTRIVERLKSDHTGIRFSDLGHKTLSDPVFAFAAAITQEARPAWTKVPYLRPSHLARPWLLLAMPLSDTGQAVDMLLCGADFGSAAVADAIE